MTAPNVALPGGLAPRGAPPAGAWSAPWAAAVQAALLGTAQAPAGAVPLPPEATVLLEGAADDGAASGDAPNADRADPSPERRLLDAAAVLATAVRAGRLPAPSGTVLPAPADADDLPVAPPAAARLLAAMLLGEYREVLPEWLARARAAGCRVPPLLLPAALDIARATPALRAPLAGALGARGRWLAGRNPDWSFARAADAASDPHAARAAWDAGTAAEREAALAALHRADPAAARALLAAAWPRENAAARARLLGALAPALGPNDEPLLEQALDDRSREVRAAAADLLARLPGSAFTARAAARALPLLRYAPGGLLRPPRLDVALPPPPDSAAERDGLVRAAPGGVGERAWWLTQLVAAVPPAAWTAALGADPDTLVALAGEGEWGSALVEGWGRASVRHRDARWAEALVRNTGTVARGRRLAFPRAELLSLLPAARREALVLDALAGRATGIPDPEHLLAEVPGPWSPALGRAALAWLRARAAHADATLHALSAVALAAPPDLADEAAEGWPAELPPYRARPVERLAAVLAFRRDLAAVFPVPTP